MYLINIFNLIIGFDRDTQSLTVSLNLILSLYVNLYSMYIFCK